MASDYMMIRQGIKTIPDFQREEEEFQLRKAQALAGKSGNTPAALQIADAYAQARAAGDTQRMNDIAIAAKSFDRGVVYDQNGNPVAMGGYGQAVGQIAGAKAGYEQNAQNASDAAYKPGIARDIAQQQANVEFATKPQIEGATQAEKDREKLLSDKAAAYEDFIQNKLPSAKTKTDQALATIKGMRNTEGTGLADDIQAVVGARNILRGAIPGTQDPENPGLPRIIAGTPAASGVAKIKQAQGQIFLEAYESLRGAGALTNIEGQKGEQAKARLSAAQNEQDFMAALADLENILSSSSTRLGQKESEANTYLKQYISPQGAVSDQQFLNQNVQPLTMNDLNTVPTQANPMGTQAPTNAIPIVPPKKGMIVDGYMFNGGNPANQSSWKKVK